MVDRAASRAERKAATMANTTTSTTARREASPSIVERMQRGSEDANIAAALSVALCTINRFLVASGHAGGGVSSLANMSSHVKKTMTEYWHSWGINEDRWGNIDMKERD